MKKLLTLGFASYLSSVTWAASAALPADPNVCAESIAEKGYCVESDVPFSGPFTLRFFVVVDKENYPTVDNLLDQYLSFDKWPSYTETVGSDTILFNKSVRMSDLKTASGEVIARQYYDYKLKSPIGYQKVRGVTHNKRLATPYAGSLATIEFVAQIDGPQDIPAGEKALDGAEGVRSQTGVINALECPAADLCQSNQWLLSFETSIAPTISILPNLAAATVERGLETILVGMLFNSQN